MNSGLRTSISASSSEGLKGSSGSGGGGEVALKKGPWTSAEDKVLVAYVERYGGGNWNAVRKKTGLLRCGKSCRLRWTNHLRPNLKKGSFTPEEERLIIELHSQLGNKWARMAAQLPGRTDNEIKNFWNTRIKRRLRDGLPLYPCSQKPRRATPLPLPQQSPFVKNQLLLLQYNTAIPLFEGQFRSGFHNATHLFDQTQSSVLLQDMSSLPIPPTRHKKYCNSAAFPISVGAASSNDHPSVPSSHGILPDTPSNFNLSSLQMEVGSMPCPSSFSLVNPELPSSQSQFPGIMKTAESCSGRFLYSDLGVFEDVTGEARAWANMPNNNFPDTHSQSGMNHTATDLVNPSGIITCDASPTQGIDPSQEDPTKQSNAIPSEVNCRRSLDASTAGCVAGAQDDEGGSFGLDLHEMASLFTVSTMAELGFLPWDNMPEIIY
ncbi:hypothetical protein MLD38_035277 [Melastoma candidum]|uniref:Uncharacterized protein n=1 Tax=Melastoma candidum TaxID=119954 RepID=A0ACB9MCC3_9MYRT|nr:hypothetical protein MLD38_035277 [Melastoma candidum]